MTDWNVYLTVRSHAGVQEVPHRCNPFRESCMASLLRRLLAISLPDSELFGLETVRLRIETVDSIDPE